MTKLVLLSIMLSLIMCLHVEHHQEDNNNPESLGEAIETIEAIRVNATSNVDSNGKINFEGDGELVEFLENVIDSEVDDLYNFETNLIPVVALNPHVCSNLTNVDRQKLVQKFESAQASVQKLVQTIENIENATLKQSLLRKANLQYLYIEQVKQGIQNDCKDQTIGRTAYFYNFNSSNWIYGEKYSQIDILNAYNTLSNEGTVTICPEDRPFVVSDSTECFKCPESSPVFDLSKQECSNCPDKTTVNPNTHRCS